MPETWFHCSNLTLSDSSSYSLFPTSPKLHVQHFSLIISEPSNLAKSPWLNLRLCLFSLTLKTSNPLPETTNPENRKQVTIAPETTYQENNKPKPLWCWDCDFWVWVFQIWVKGEEDGEESWCEEDGEMGFWGLKCGMVGKKEEKRNRVS